MKKLTLFIIVCLVIYLPRFAAAKDTPTGSGTSTDKALVIQVEVPAALDDVWNAFATSDGLSTWLFPNATVDLRPGGDWLVHFPGGSTGGGTIVSFVPKKELVIAALCPDQFPHVRAERTHAVFTFEAHGSSTIVRLTQTGWKTGPEWDSAYEYLTSGNAQLMSSLVHRFVNGPTDWKKAFAAAGHNLSWSEGISLSLAQQESRVVLPLDSRHGIIGIVVTSEQASTYKDEESFHVSKDAFCRDRCLIHCNRFCGRALGKHGARIGFATLPRKPAVDFAGRDWANWHLANRGDLVRVPRAGRDNNVHIVCEYQRSISPVSDL